MRRTSGRFTCPRTARSRRALHTRTKLVRHTQSQRTREVVYHSAANDLGDHPPAADEIFGCDHRYGRGHRFPPARVVYSQLALDALVAGTASLGQVLLPAAAGLVACHALHGFFTYLRGRWAAQASEGIVRQLRHDLYSHLERLPCAYHDRADTGRSRSALLFRCGDAASFPLRSGRRNRPSVAAVAGGHSDHALAKPVDEPCILGAVSCHHHLCHSLLSQGPRPVRAGRQIGRPPDDGAAREPHRHTRGAGLCPTRIRNRKNSLSRS